MRACIDWKYALSLPLTDEGCDFTVLSQFRTCLFVGGAEQRLLETMLAVYKERGLLKERGKQRTDSTHILAAIRILNRLCCVGEALHAVFNTLSFVTPNGGGLDGPGGLQVFGLTGRVVPESGSVAMLMGMGMTGAGFLRKRRSHSA